MSRLPSNSSAGGSSLGDWLRLIAGAILLVVGLLWTVSTELNAVRDQRRRHRMQDQIRVVASDTLLDLENGQLIAMSGETLPLTPLSDPEFHAKADAIHMRRVVEFYQWTAHSEKGEAAYRKEWTRSQVDSTDFPAEHQNPQQTTPPPGPWTGTSQKVSFGSFQLSAPLVRELQDYHSWIPEHMIPPEGWHSSSLSDFPRKKIIIG